MSRGERAVQYIRTGADGQKALVDDGQPSHHEDDNMKLAVRTNSNPFVH